MDQTEICHLVKRYPNTSKGSLMKTFWEKGKMLVTSIFSYFPRCFLPYPKQISIFDTHLICHLQILLIWTTLKICRLVEIITCLTTLSKKTFSQGKQVLNICFLYQTLLSTFLKTHSTILVNCS